MTPQTAATLRHLATHGATHADDLADVVNVSEYVMATILGWLLHYGYAGRTERGYLPTVDGMTLLASE